MNSTASLLIPPCLRAVLPLRPIVLADAVAAGGIHDRWAIFAAGEGLKVLGFEPDQRAYDVLPKREDRVWVNAALADREGQAFLHVTRHQTNTSLLPPNRSIVERIYQNPSDFDIVSDVMVPCTTLDEASRASGLRVTVLKADTQGTEFAILRGAERCLRESLLAVEVEVEFTQLYSGQHLFSAVDVFMRDHGFMLFDLGNLLCHKWHRSSHIGGRKGQLLAADALYFRTPESLLNLTDSLSERRVLLAQYWAVCAVYGYIDLAYEIYLEQANAGLLHKDLVDEVKAWAEKTTRRSVRRLDFRGRGLIASWIRRLADQVDPVHHSVWLNPLGNK